MRNKICTGMEVCMEKYKIMVKGIVKNENKYLMVKRWYDDRIGNPYQWEFVDGKIEFGEAPEKAVIRHIKENLGIEAVINRILYTWSYMVGDTFNIGICYECIGIQSEVILSEDLHEYRWVLREELDDLIENKGMLEDLKRAEM